MAIPTKHFILNNEFLEMDGDDCLLISIFTTLCHQSLLVKYA